MVTNDQGLSWRVRAPAPACSPAANFGSAAAHPAPSLGIGGAGAQPARSGLRRSYTGFIESGGSARFRGEKQADLATWIERLYEGDPQLAERAARWLGNSNEKAALEPLHDALTHDDAGVRAAALLALGDLGDPAALPDLCDRLIEGWQ